MGEGFQIIGGRKIGEPEIREIRRLIEENDDQNRRWISLELCRRWEWKQANGKPKDMAARNLLLTLQRKGLLQLPSPQAPDNNHSHTQAERYTGQEILKQSKETGHNEEPLEGTVGDYGRAELEQMKSKAEHRYWNLLIQRYHYLGYRCMVGPSLKYLIYAGKQRVGAIGWGSGLWKLGLEGSLHRLG